MVLARSLTLGLLAVVAAAKCGGNEKDTRDGLDHGRSHKQEHKQDTATHTKKQKSKPNIVLIYDQDKHSVQREVMPHLYEHVIDKGVWYENFFAPVSLCCPSRASLLRIQAAHNHNITYVAEPWGGWTLFNKYGYVNHTLPDFLQQSGYNTYYVGKYMNDHTAENCVTLPVSGYNGSDFLVDPYTYDFWNPGFSHNNGPVETHNGSYSTDMVLNKSMAHLNEALGEERPFWIGIAPIAPHSWIPSDTPADSYDMYPPPPAPRHAKTFPEAKIPRTESFNPNEAMGVSWVKQLPKLNATVVDYLDAYYRDRLRALVAVDELVDAVVKRLEEAGKIDNTYIFYTADNGFAMGTHRRQPGKTLGYEEDIHVPLAIRGPGMPQGVIDSVSSYGIVDMARTFLELAGGKADYKDDGTMMNLHHDEGECLADDYTKHRHSMAEYWVYGIEEGKYAGPIKENNTYRTLRVHDEVDGKVHTYSYSVWCTGERELYDLVEDPYQVRNVLAPLNDLGPFIPFDAANNGKPVFDRETQRLLHRLDGLALILKTCKEDTCPHPYGAMFPGDDTVGTFHDTLDAKYDDYFAALPKVHFDHCALGYQSRLEQPEWTSKMAFRAK